MRSVAAIAAAATLLSVLAGCGDPGATGSSPTAAPTEAGVRATRRAYDGAPPVIPHQPHSADCITCHGGEGTALPEGFAPPMPHDATRGLSGSARCTQCHLWKKTNEVFVANDFTGMPQDLRRGDRLHPLAPPVIPHPVFMRERCHACHTGPAAREEVRCTHPERTACFQCHLEHRTSGEPR